MWNLRLGELSNRLKVTQLVVGPGIKPSPLAPVSASKLKILRVFRPQMFIPHPQWWYPQTPRLSPFLWLGAVCTVSNAGGSAGAKRKTLGVSKGAERGCFQIQTRQGWQGQVTHTHTHTDNVHMFLSLDYWCGQQALGLSRGHSTLAVASSVRLSYSSCLTCGLPPPGPTPSVTEWPQGSSPKEDPRRHGPQGLHSRRSGGETRTQETPKAPIVFPTLSPTFLKSLV